MKFFQTKGEKAFREVLTRLDNEILSWYKNAQDGQDLDECMKKAAMITSCYSIVLEIFDKYYGN